MDTPPKTNIDTKKNDGLKDVSWKKHGYFGYRYPGSSMRTNRYVGKSGPLKIDR